MRYRHASGVASLVLLIACERLGDQEACDKVNELCSSETACNPALFDSVSNEAVVKECLERAAYCSAATTCLRRAIPERPDRP